MKRILFALLLLAACLDVRATTNVVATVTFTNVINGVTNGGTITVNGDQRNYTNGTLASAATWIQSTNIVGHAATNTFYHLGNYPVTGVARVEPQDTNQIVITSDIQTGLTVTLSAGIGTVTYVTNDFGQLFPTMLPIESHLTAAARTNQQNRLINALNNSFATSQVLRGASSFTNFVNLYNHQTLSNKTVYGFTNSIGQLDGVRSTNTIGLHGTNNYLQGGILDGNRATNVIALAGTNHSLYGGTITAVTLANIASIKFATGQGTNLYGTNFVLDSPITTNLINRGNAISSPGTGSGSEQFGSTATASGTSSTALGQGTVASGEASISIGSGAESGYGNDVAIGAGAASNSTNAVAVGNGANVQASAPQGMAIGYNTTVAAYHTNSIAFGPGTITTKTNQIMLGASTHLVEIPGRLLVTATITNPVVTGASKVGVSGGPYSTLSIARNDVSSMAAGANTLNVAGSSFVKVSGAGAPFSIVGITNGASGNLDGQLIMIENLSGDAMTIANQSGLEVVAANRIITGTGQDYSLGSNGVAGLIYDSAASRWVVMWRPRLLPVWGQINTRSNTIADPLATAGTFYQVTNFTAGGGNGVTVDTTNDRIQVGEGGTYEVGAHVSFSGTASETFTWAIHTNGVPVNHLYAVRAPGTGGDVGALSFSSFVYLPTNCLVDLRVTSSSDSDTITMTHGGLKVELKQ